MIDMKFISICSGIEAASVAFNVIGWKAVAFSEIEPFPCSLLAHHYPDIPNFGDMIKFREWPEEVFVQADMIVGGPPCQSFSVAGKREGLNDDRGNLTLIYTELIDHADTIRLKHGKPPVIILYENVPGLLSDKTGAFGCFLSELAGEPEELQPTGAKWSNAGMVLGPQRTIAWRILDAQYFGVAQRRKRVFVVASVREGFDPSKILFEFDGVRRDSEPRVEYDETEYPSASYGRPFDMLGFGQYGRGLTSSTCKARDYKDATDLVVMPDGRVRRLTPIECERLQGFPDNYTAIPWRKKPASECPDGPRYKALGNSWAVPVVRWIGQRIKNNLI